MIIVIISQMYLVMETDSRVVIVDAFIIPPSLFSSSSSFNEKRLRFHHKNNDIKVFETIMNQRRTKNNVYNSKDIRKRTTDIYSKSSDSDNDISDPLYQINQMNDNSIDDIVNEQNIEKNDDEKPRYRSKLQRLNQAQQAKKNYNIDEMYDKSDSKKKIKTKLKNNKQPLSFKEKDLSSMKQDQMPFGLLNDISTTSTIDEDYAIDSFLRGEYDRPFAEDAAAPLPNHSPSQIVEIALKALRDLDTPTTDHGAAVFMRFCAPLSRQDRWGNTSIIYSNSNNNTDDGRSGTMIDNWKNIMRGALTPTMLARRIRASKEFSVLLDWEMLDVTKGTQAIPNKMLGYDSTIAFVNAALHFGDGVEPSVCQITLKMFNGVWLIDTATVNNGEWFMDP